MMKTIAIAMTLLALLGGCAFVPTQTLSDEQARRFATDHARSSAKCAAILKKHPDMLVHIGNPEFNVIARHEHGTTREETAYQLPVVRREENDIKVTFWHNGQAYDSTSYFIDVYLNADGSLQKVEVRERPGGYR